MNILINLNIVPFKIAYPFKKCVTLRVFDENIKDYKEIANATSSFYSVVWDGHIVEDRFLERHSPHEMLLCDWNKTCENDETFLGLVFNTDAFPDVFSWKLVNSNTSSDTLRILGH